MKKTVSAGLGGRNFIFDEDAFARLNSFLDAYRGTLKENATEVMEEVEMRVADLLRDGLGSAQVVNIAMVNAVAAQLGFPEPDAARGQRTPQNDGQYAGSGNRGNYYWQGSEEPRPVHRFFRDSDDKRIGGVCSGIAAFADLDVTLVRVIFLVLLICGSAGFWVYLVICIAAPCAYTATEKCQLRGLPCTAENLARFTTTQR